MKTNNNNGNTAPAFSIKVSAESLAAFKANPAAFEPTEETAPAFDVDELNAEFVKLLDEHENDTEVKGASRTHFEAMTEGETDPDIISLWAMACNSWDELCNRHEGLSESGLNWFAGAEFVGYSNPWDLYIGTGEEPYIK